MRSYLCALGEAEIQTLEASGIKLTPADIVRINALALRVENPQTALALARGVPVCVGGASLWPLTLAGADWFRRVGGNLGGIKLQTHALAYAMAHGRTTMPDDPATAASAVKAWAKKLTCRHQELDEAIRQVIEQDESPDTGETGPSASVGEISLMLSAMTHIKPEVWEYQCSIPYVLAMMDAMVRQNAANGESTKHDPRIKAERALGLAVWRIRQRHKKEAA